MNDKTLIDRQIALEEEMVGMGISRYRANAANKEEADLPPGQQLIRRFVEDVATGVREFIEASRSGKAGRKHRALHIVEAVDPEAAAFLGLRAILSSAVNNKSLQYCFLLVATAIEDHLDFLKFKDANAGYANKIVLELDKRTNNTKHRKKVLRGGMDKLGVEKTSWSERERMSLGQVVYEIVEARTGLVKRVRVSDSKNDTPVRLEATPECEAWLREAHERCELLDPYFLPMICPPRNWTSPFAGGYLTPHIKAAAPSNVIRGFFVMKTWNRAYMDELAATHMPGVYNAVNAAQATPWKINAAVLNVLKTVWASGGTMGGLPDAEDLALPKVPEGVVAGVPIDKMPIELQDKMKAWKAEAVHVHLENSRNRSKRLAVVQKLYIADKFKDEEAIYFPHQMDWRGRLYPAPPYVNPQADDSGKALLQFAVGKPLGESGAFWLAVHIANLFGVDKISFEDRVAWVMEHENQILDSALDPLDGERFWTEADSPYCALAACFEWAGYRVQGDEYVSHIPIAMDGSCSGLQHFSAMLRDEVGGAAVNLVPSPKPADIYTAVAKVAQAKVDKLDTLEARLWKGNKVVRKIAKQPCMTLCYGASLRGMQDQIKAALRKLDTDLPKDQTYLATDSNHEPSRFMGKIVKESIGEVVVAAKRAMAWLQDVARVAASEGLPVRWTTPMGLVVQQEYRVMDGKRWKVYIGGKEVKLMLSVTGKKLDKKRQASGISPNFVHSLDSAHLMATINTLVASGVTSLACIHDSFGTHAADVDVLHKAIRTAFVDQYSPDVLGEFREEIAKQLPQELAEKIPPLPEVGQLDLASVMEADYAFA